MNIIGKVNEELIENNGLDRTIINPVFGKVFQGPLRNLRCFYHGIIPDYEEDDERCFKRDKWVLNPKSNEYDRLASGIINFYPSPAGTLCTTTTGTDNLLRKFFDSSDLGKKFISIGILAMTFTNILKMCRDFENGNQAAEDYPNVKEGQGLLKFLETIKDKWNKTLPDYKKYSAELPETDISGARKNPMNYIKDLIKTTESEIERLKVFLERRPRNLNNFTKTKDLNDSVIKLYDRLNDYTEIVKEYTNNEGKIHFMLLLIHSFALDVLDTENEYRLYLNSIIKEITKEENVILPMFKLNVIGIDYKEPKGNLPIDSPNEPVSSSLYSDDQETNSISRLLKTIYEYNPDKFPYSNKNPPASNSTILNYKRKTDERLNAGMFADCVEMFILHLCNCLFYNEETCTYSVEHLKLDEESSLYQFYKNHSIPFAITTTIRNDWSKVVQDLEGLVMGEGEEAKTIQIKYGVNKEDFQNELESGFINIATVLAKICESSKKGEIQMSYKTLLDKSLSSGNTDISNEYLEFIKSLAPDDLEIEEIPNEGISRNNKFKDYRGYLNLKFTSKYNGNNTEMSFDVQLDHAEVYFISRNTQLTENNPFNDFKVKKLSESVTPLEYLLRDYVLDLKGANRNYNEENFHFLYYPNPVQISNPMKKNFLELFYNFFDDSKIKVSGFQ